MQRHLPVQLHGLPLEDLEDLEMLVSDGHFYKALDCLCEHSTVATLKQKSKPKTRSTYLRGSEPELVSTRQN